jgi:homoserine O-succinyltransferase/O-acetyltransferase
MLTCFDPLPSMTNPRTGANPPPRKSLAEFREPDANCIDIGLINNMPGSALEATERQFRALLGAASEGIVVRLSFFALPDVPRSDEGRRRISSFYSSVSDLWDNRLDGLIVTGAEPLAQNLTDEPYWGSLTKLLEWAEHNTHSTIWSCLAAHAALLEIDGIRRRPLSDKLSGVFECAKASDSPLTASISAPLWMPHSRWNDIPEDALAACGYRVLTRSEDAGIDVFVKQRKSLFVFFQGHPEYDADSLVLEYRRDIRRFLRGERNSYPSMPRGCFDADAAAVLAAVRERALSDRREDLLADFSPALLAAKVRNTWRPAAVSIYRNWLLSLCAQKERQLKSRPGQREYKPVRPVAFGQFLETGAQQTREMRGDAQ